MPRCAAYGCTSTTTGITSRKGWLCTQHHVETFLVVSRMMFVWRDAHEPEGTSPAEGVQEARFGWMRGARRYSESGGLEEEEREGSEGEGEKGSKSA